MPTTTQLTLIKQSLTQYATVGDIVSYTITASNYGTIPLTNVTVSDLFPTQLEFITGSVKIDTIPAPCENLLLGVNLGTLTGSQSKSIGFKAKILSLDNGTIPNIANADFYFTPPGSTTPQLGSSVSNTFNINVFDADLAISKIADVTNVNLFDYITYTVTIVNDGNLDADNVIFFDCLPSVTTLVNGSFNVNGSVFNNVDLTQGVNIGSLPVASSTTIVYQVQVLASTCSGNIVNDANAEFNFILPDGTCRTKQVCAIQNASVTIFPSSFRQVILDEYLKIPYAKPDIENINSIRGDVEILNSHIIQTQVAKSTEGQQLSGFKLIIHGVLKEIIEYSACETDQSVHSAHYNIPFSSFIILPSNLNTIRKLDVEGIVESISTSVIDPRNFYNNATILLIAKILYC